MSWRTGPKCFKVEHFVQRRGTAWGRPHLGPLDLAWAACLPAAPGLNSLTARGTAPAPILTYDPLGPSGPGLSQAALTHWATAVSPVKWSSHSNS